MENCYCSVQFQTGEELDEALLKAKTACDEADKAVAARTAIENMKVEAVALSAGATPTVEKTTEDGVVKLTFGLVPGARGATGRDGLDGNDGADGVGIAGIDTTYDSGWRRTRVTIYLTNGSAKSFYVYDGQGIEEVYDTYNSTNKCTEVGIVLENGAKTTFQIPDGRVGEAGADGADGVSPTVEVGEVSKATGSGFVVLGHKVTITDADGTKEFTVWDGEPGASGSNINTPGEDGVSVTGATIDENGHLWITLSDGLEIDCGVAVGEDGEDGYTPVKGTDYWTEEDKQEIVEEVLTQIGGDGESREQFDVGNFSGGSSTYREGFYTYKDNGTNFTYTMPYPQQGAVTVTIRFERDTAYASESADIIFVYSDGTEETRRGLALDVTHTLISDAEKTLTKITGFYAIEQFVYIDLSVMSIVFGSPESSDDGSGGESEWELLESYELPAGSAEVTGGIEIFFPDGFNDYLVHFYTEKTAASSNTVVYPMAKTVSGANHSFVAAFWDYYPGTNAHRGEFLFERVVVGGRTYLQMSGGAETTVEGKPLDWKKSGWQDKSNRSADLASWYSVKISRTVAAGSYYRLWGRK